MKKISLGGIADALKSGLERRLAGMMNRGTTREEAAQWVLDRTTIHNQADAELLASHAGQMFLAAISTNGLRGDEMLPISDIPVNQYLHEDEDITGRVLVTGKISFDDGEHWYSFTQDFPDNPTPDEIREAVGDSFNNWGRQYPGRFKGIDSIEGLIPLIVVESEERGF